MGTKAYFVKLWRNVFCFEFKQANKQGFDSRLKVHSFLCMYLFYCYVWHICNYI